MPGEVHHLDTIEKLRAVIGQPGAGIELKIYDHLPEEAAAFLGLAPFLVLATSDADGRLDASPKGDAPGFVRIEDDRTIVIPDRPGNKLAYGLTNIVSNPRVGLIFLIPGTTETLRINGTAELRDDPELLESLAARGKPAVLAIRVTIEECFFHCSKAFLRSQLWDPARYVERSELPSSGEMHRRRDPSFDAEAYDAERAERYARREGFY